MMAKSNEMKRLSGLTDSNFKKEMEFNGDVANIDALKTKLSLQIRNSAILKDMPSVGQAGGKALISAIPAPRVDVKSMPGILDFFSPSPSNLTFEYNCHSSGSCGVKIYE